MNGGLSEVGRMKGPHCQCEMELACFSGVGAKLNDSGSAQDCAPLLCGDVKGQSWFRKVCLSVL